MQEFAEIPILSSRIKIEGVVNMENEYVGFRTHKLYEISLQAKPVIFVVNWHKMRENTKPKLPRLAWYRAGLLFLWMQQSVK